MASLEPVPNTPLRDDPTQDSIWKRWLSLWWKRALYYVSGPASSTNNAVARFDGMDGKTIQNSGVIIDDSNNVTGVAGLTATSITDSGLTATRVTFASTDGLLADSANFTYVTGTGQLALATTGSGAGILIGGDTQLYRAAADILLTPDSLTVGGILRLTAGGALVTSDAAAIGINILNRPTSDDFGILRFLNNAGTVAQGQIRSGTGNALDLITGTGGGSVQVSITNTASATRYITLTGSNGGNPTISTNAGSLAITPDIVAAGDIAVNGGDITTSQTTFNLLDATATTINFGSAATTMRIGAAQVNIGVGATGASDTTMTVLTDAGSYAFGLIGRASDNVSIVRGLNNAANTEYGQIKFDASGLSLGVTGLTTVVGIGSGNALTVSDSSNTTSGANIGLVGNGGTTPNKYIRAFSGTLEYINSAYTAVIASLTDGGVFSNTMGASATLSPTITKANVNTTAVGNVGTGEDDLITYSLPTNSFNTAGRGIRLTAWGTTSGGVESRTVKAYFGSTAVLTTTSMLATYSWKVVMEVFSTGTDTQDCFATFTQGTSSVLSVDHTFATSTQNDGAAITLKLTGQATNTDAIVQQGMLVEFLN